jgi:copper homeostasis protein (lipoprotein)
VRTLAPLSSLLLAALSACSSPTPERTETPAVPTVPARAIGALSGPSSWRGELPCADCAGIATTITLSPDGTYRRQAAYLGTSGGGDTILTDIGRWTHAAEGTRVHLRGSAEAPSHYAVDADGALRQLDLEGNDIASDLDYRLPAVADPVVIAHPSRLVAAFSYMADAATAVECRSGLVFPVDMSGEYLTVERGYGASGVRPGAPWVVRLKAHLDDRPAMEGDGTTLSLVVDSLLGSNPDDACEALRTQDAVAAHAWRLVALSGPDGPLPMPADNRATFQWDRSEGRFAGNSGCNRYSASGLLRGSTLAAGPAMGTKMACLAPEANAVETRLLALLSAQPSLRVQADTLVFSDGPADVARWVRQ